MKITPWSETDSSNWNSSIDRKPEFRIYNIKDVASDAELKEPSCQCLIHSRKSGLSKPDAAATLDHKFNGKF